MTSRVQVFRTPTTGVAPAAGTRLPGELWVNFADLQLGVIDASKNAQNLIAVRFFSTQANYIAGECVKHSGKLWIANGSITAGAFSISQWTQIASMTDVGAMSINDNRIINGDMRIDQRNAGAAITPPAGSVYTVDRWKFQGSQASKFIVQRGTSGAGMLALGWPSYLGIASSSAYASLTTDNFAISQFIEAEMTSDFAWGTPGAQPVTLSFMALCSLTGAFSGSIRNDTNTRSYPFSFSLVANTWAKVAITIPGDTAGTWASSGNVLGLYVAFDLGSGADFRGPANAWAATSYSGVTGAISVAATNGAFFNLTGVKLEIGSVATPYNRQSAAKNVADCQRYYLQGIAMYSACYSAAGQTFGQHFTFPVTMRATPTITPAGVAYINANTITMANASPVGVTLSALAGALGQAQVSASIASSFSAEL